MDFIICVPLSVKYLIKTVPIKVMGFDKLFQLSIQVLTQIPIKGMGFVTNCPN